MTDHDDELFERLRRADPAAFLPPADPHRVDRLLEDAMSPDTVMAETRETGVRDRSPLTWLVAAAAVVLIAAAGVFTFGSFGDDPTPTVGPNLTSPSAEPTVTDLTLPAAVAGRCMVPNARVLSGAAYAVDAEVVSVDDGVATLDATQWYAGEPTDLLEVRQGSADLQALIGAPGFEPGQRFLVAGTDDGQVMVCGFSGPHTPALDGLYAEAFGS